MTHYETICDMPTCGTRKPFGTLYCAEHSSPGWDMYRRWKRRFFSALLAFIAVPLLIAAAGVAWRIAILAVFE